ncbi:MAG: transcription antitermination factor NusB [Eggerthellaceae bacterium]|jgi:N utilization substance protein B
MAAKRHKRTEARRAAVALLYSSDITKENATTIVERGVYPADQVEPNEYAEEVLRGVTEHQAEIDDLLISASENWLLDRMPVVDRAILRLAVYEILYIDEVPISVSINEAVDLAKEFGGEDESSRFVNGVLGKIARKLEEESEEDNTDE